VQNATLWRGLLGLDNAVVEGVEFDEDGGVLVASVRPSKGKRNRCGQCPRRCPSYDAGSGGRRWRALDLGSVQVFVEADAPRVTYRDHGVVVASVPWARHDAGHTRAFDEQVAWLATKTSKTAVTELMRVACRTVGSIVERVWDDTEGLFGRQGQADILDTALRPSVGGSFSTRNHRWVTFCGSDFRFGIDRGRRAWLISG
jgi:transposase